MTKKQDLSFLSTITDDQAARVLTLLLDENQELIPKAALIAKTLLSDVEEEGICQDVCAALSELDVHDLWEESGRTRHGYVEPCEHSYEMMEDIIEPFLDEMERYLDRKMVNDAHVYCRGIISGICIYMSEEAGEFADWAVDNDDGLTYDVIERWKSKNKNPDIVADLEAWREKCLKSKSG